MHEHVDRPAILSLAVYNDVDMHGMPVVQPEYMPASDRFVNLSKRGIGWAQRMQGRRDDLCGSSCCFRHVSRAGVNRSPFARRGTFPVVESSKEGIGIFVAQQVCSFVQLER
jgi:hypothetical protein